MLTRSIYLSAERACIPLLNIRGVSDSPGNKFKYVYAWPSSRIIKSNVDKDLLRNLGIKLRDKAPFVKSYEISISTNIINSDFDYLRFRFLRNYFSIKNLLSFGEEVKITLEYRDIKFDNYKTELTTDNSDLITYLMNHNKRDELTWVFTDIEDNLVAKIHFTQAELLFVLLDFASGRNITLKQKGPKRGKFKNYILSSDVQHYNRVANETFSNMQKCIDDQELFKKSKQHFKNYDWNSDPDQ